MRLEHLPILVGLLVGLVGAGLIADAWLPDELVLRRDRRRRRRAERNRPGEALIGLGALCMAAAFVSRGAWRWDTVAVLVGTLLFSIGLALNWRYLRELTLYRGAARRMPDGTLPPGVPEHTPQERPRIR